MSTRKFTEGPWAASKHADSAGRIGVGQINNTFDIAKVFGQENARLIAAAPELYEKLELLLRRIESKQYDQLLDESEINTVKCLLNKVKGE